MKSFNSSKVLGGALDRSSKPIAMANTPSLRDSIRVFSKPRRVNPSFSCEDLMPDFKYDQIGMDSIYSLRFKMEKKNFQLIL